MQNATIKGFFNPQRQGDTFKGLNGSIKGSLASRIHSNLFEFLKDGGRDYFIKKVPARIYDPVGAIDADGHLVPGDIDVDSYRLTVRGHVNQTLALSLKDILQGLPRFDIAAPSRP